MPRRNVVSYNSLISGLTRLGLHEDSVKLFRVMQNGVIDGMEWNVIFNNALIDAYGKCREPNLWFSVFCWMPERNAVSSTSMVVA
ncbi:hypothetical protein JHK85_011242 [Glycine max]|nr:hypothetical protein JHK85_011242 [Glycine max]